MKDFFRRAVVWILTLEARAVIRRYKPRIVLVTGSVGKTSTKDALYAALSGTHFVRRSEKSYNSDVGAPLAILGVPNGWSNPLQWLRNISDGLFLLLIRVPYPEWLIVEVGADRPGDITKSLAWLKPKVVVATRFPAVPVHVEFYENPEEVQAEELAPLMWLKPGGVAVVNGDDEIAGGLELPEGVLRITFGTHTGLTVRASRFKTLSHAGMPTGISFDLQCGNEKAHVSFENLVGNSHVSAILGGVAGALATGVAFAAAVQAVQSYSGAPGRMRLIEGDGYTIVDDTYNASPVAVREALKTLATIPAKGRRVAVLGDMLELGAYSVSEHVAVGEAVAESADILVTVGMRARKIAEGALQKGMSEEKVLQFDRALDAAEHLRGVVGAGDVILVKGSQGVRMERAVKELMAHPEDAKKLLCRQDAEWLTR